MSRGVTRGWHASSVSVGVIGRCEARTLTASLAAPAPSSFLRKKLPQGTTRSRSFAGARGPRRGGTAATKGSATSFPLPIATASCNKAAQATDPNKQPHKNCQLDINHSTRGTPCQPQSLPATGAAPAACATAPGTGDLRYQRGGRREGRQNPPKMGQKPSSENRNHFSRSAEMPALTHYSPQQQKTLLRYFFFY